MKRVLTISIVLFSFLQILAQDTLFPKHAAVQFSNLLQGTDAAYAFATYDQIWEGAVLSGGEYGYDYPDIPGYGDHANEIYPLGSTGFAQELHFKAKLLNPNQMVLTHRNLSFIECIQFDYGKSSPQRWFVDNLSPKWFAYTVLTHLTDSIFSKNPNDTVFHIPVRDARIMYRRRKKIDKDSIPPNWDGYWRKNHTRYYWDYICFKDNDAGSGRGEFEIMAIKKIDTLTGAITVARKIKNGKVRGRTLYGTPQSYSKGARLGYICHSNRISGSPSFMMNSYLNRGDSLYEIEMMADGYDWIGACAQYVEEFMMPTAYTGLNPKTQRDTTIYLIDGVILDVGGEEWVPYNFDRDGWPYYALDMNWDGKIDWVGFTQDSLLQSPDWDTLSAWLVKGNILYAQLVYGAAERHNRDFYISTNGVLLQFPTYFNGRYYEDFNGLFQDTYGEAIDRYVEINKPGNVVDPMIVAVFERDRDSSKVGVHNFKDHRHIMALTTILGNGAYGHCGDYSTHNKFMNSWQPNLGQLNPEDWFDEFAVDSLGQSSKYLYPEGNALHRFKNRKWLGRALTDAIKLDSMYKPGQQLYAYTFIRYFEHGVAIYSQYHHKLKIQGNYKKILGLDPGNDGSVIRDSIEMLEKDGLFLFKFQDTRIAKFRKRPHLIFYNNESRLLWQLDTAGICTVKWGLDTFCTEGNIVINDYTEDFNYRYDFTNLNLNSKYYYKINIDNGDTKTGSFYTAVSSDEQEFGFLVFGDTRSNQTDQNRIFGRMNQSYTNDEKYQSFAISTGDFVTDGGDEKDWDKEFFNPLYPQIQYLLGNLPIQSVMGNHEKDGKLFKKYFPYDFEDGGYYSFEYGSAIFVFLDQYLNSNGLQEELSWLQNTLKNTDKKWKFIVLHEPGYSAGGHENNNYVQKYIQPLAVKYGVQIVFGGHNHYYSRAEVGGVTHITTGGGGAPLYNPQNSQPYIVKAKKAFHFCKIDIDNNNLHFEVISDHNEMIDQFDISLNTSGTNTNNSLNSNATQTPVTVSPNPFTNSITFSFRDSNSKLKGIEIYDISGKKVKTIPKYDDLYIVWNGKNSNGEYVKDGMYIYRIIFDKSVRTGKIVRVGKKR